MIAPRPNLNLEVRQPCPSGQHAWLADLHAAHGPRLKRMLRRMLGDEQDALDVYQDCMYHLARRCDHTLPQSPQAYAYRTAANLATETIRRRGRHTAHWPRIVGDHCARSRVDGSGSSASPAASPHTAVAGLHRAVRSLPRHLRAVIVLRDLAGLPYQQVALMLGIQPTTARVYRRQAVVRLGEMLDPGQPAN